jgi:hypothetical protein
MHRDAPRLLQAELVNDHAAEPSAAIDGVA